MINLGIAGLGKMGKMHYLNAKKSDITKVVAVADLKKSNLKNIVNSDINKYEDYKLMIDKENLDAIIISLPNFLKKESIVYSAENDLSIFVDKPISRNFEEAKEIIKKIENKHIGLMVGVNYRFFDCVKKIKDIVDEGSIGEVVLNTSDLIMDGPFSHPLVPTPVSEWWFDKEKAGGGVLIDLGYHLIDLLLWILGELDVEYSALKYRYNLDIEDAATVILKSKNGAICTLNVGWFSKMIFPNFNFRLNFHGTVGYASTDHFIPRSLYVHAAKEGVKNFFRMLSLRKPNYLSYTYYYSSFVDILHNFLYCINNDIDFPFNVQSQLSVMKCIDEIYKKSEVDENE